MAMDKQVVGVCCAVKPDDESTRSLRYLAVETMGRVFIRKRKKLEEIREDSKAKDVIYSDTFGVGEVTGRSIKGMASFTKLIDRFFKNVPDGDFPAHEDT